MEIFVNNEKLQFQLENEKTLKDVLESLNNWLFKNMKVIEAIVIDGKVHTDEIQKLNSCGIDGIKKLELTVININELIFNSLSETKNYLREIHKFMSSKDDFNEGDITRLLSGLHWVINIFSRINNIYNYEIKFTGAEFHFSKELNTLVKIRKDLEQLFDSKKYDKITGLIKESLMTSVNNWYNNIDNLLNAPPESLNNLNTVREKVSGQVYKIIKKIPDMQKLIEMTTMDIQTGHENEAMTNIQIILGTVESIIALLQLIKSTFTIDYHKINYNNESIETFNKNLTYLLKELLEGMKIKDTVLISDLLTYELIPKIEQYGEILKLITKELNIEIN